MAAEIGPELCSDCRKLGGCVFIGKDSEEIQDIQTLGFGVWMSLCGRLSRSTNRASKSSIENRSVALILKRGLGLILCKRETRAPKENLPAKFL